MQAVVLAGGAGTRLRPLTYATSKPLIPVLNIPLIAHTVAHLRKSGITSFIFSLCYRAEDIVEYFSEAYEDLAVQSTVEREPMGTAGALKLVQPILSEGPVFIMNGDIFTTLSIQRLLETHKRTGAEVTVALKEVEDPSPYGLVLTDRKHRVLRFIEKPTESEITDRTVNAGLYIFNQEVLERIPANRNFSLERQLFPLLLEENVPFYAEVFTDYWMDVGNFSSYFAVTKDILSGKARSPLFPVNLQNPRSIWKGSEVTIHPGAEVAGFVVIGDRAVIEDGAFIDEYTVIGPRSLVRRDSYISDSILLEGVVVGERCRIRGSLLGKNSIIEDDSVVSFGNILADGAVIPRGSILPLSL